MHRHLKLLLLLPLAFALMGCPPTSGPGPNPPDVSWSVFNVATQETQTFGQNGGGASDGRHLLADILGESTEWFEIHEINR